MMAPGGLLLWCGFNPWSPWLAWIHWHTRGGGRGAADVERGFGAPAPAQVEPGCRWHSIISAASGRGAASIRSCADPVEAQRRMLWAPLRGAYLLAARKQRAVLTPLRPRVKRTRRCARRASRRHAEPARLRMTARARRRRSRCSPTAPAWAIPARAAGRRLLRFGTREKELSGGETRHDEQPHGVDGRDRRHRGVEARLHGRRHDRFANTSAAASRNGWRAGKPTAG